MQETENNKRLVRNTLLLYFRMLLILIVGLYTSRVVLATLGISDYGLYNVVGGIVSMFAFFNASLSSSTQRYLNYELGRNNSDKLKSVFSTSLLLHFFLVCIILFFAETIGLWFVLEKLNIPEGREVAAMWVYQLSIIAACVQLIQLPFMSVIIAHEQMDVYAYVSIFDVVMKLLIVFLLQVWNTDKLILYACLYLIIQLLSATIYNLYCQRKFDEARFRFSYDKLLFREMFGFSGWNVIGNVASVCNNYGLNIVFNLFFGTAVNAARGVSYQVNSLVQQFSSNFQIAVKPQVVKYYANEKMEEMNRLVYNSAKYSALLLLFVSIPIALEIEFILSIWLGVYPDYTPSFVRIILFHSIVSCMIGPVLMVIHATGYLKAVAITAGIFNLSLLPLNYTLMSFGCAPEVALCINVLGSIVETFIELLWMKHYINFPILEFYKKVYCTVFSLGLIMLFVPLIAHFMLSEESDILRFFIVSFISVLTSGFILWKWGIDQNIKYKIINKFSFLKIFI